MYILLTILHTDRPYYSAFSLVSDPTFLDFASVLSPPSLYISLAPAKGTRCPIEGRGRNRERENDKEKHSTSPLQVKEVVRRVYDFNTDNVRRGEWLYAVETGKAGHGSTGIHIK